MTYRQRKPLPQVPDAPAQAQDFWVFGYGSLVWRPGFAYVERRLATIHGYHRALCILSHVHRGTPERPGLVLGLDRGGSCRGIAFRVADTLREATLAYLREREQVTSVYLELVRPVRLDDGRLVNAVTYAVDRQHGQYSGALTPDEVVRLVRQGIGHSGANPEYILNTYEHLLMAGIRDRALKRIVDNLALTHA
jgi:cation transport protein ChaC